MKGGPNDNLFTLEKGQVIGTGHRDLTEKFDYLRKFSNRVHQTA